MTENQGRRGLIGDSLARIADAAERIAVAVEKVAGSSEQLPAFVAVPMQGTVRDETIYRKWHAAAYEVGSDAVPRCGAKGQGPVSMNEAIPLRQVPLHLRCASPGCEQIYARYGQQ